MNVARSGTNVPGAALCAIGGHIAAAGLAVEAALHAPSSDVPGSRVQIDVTRSGLFNLDVPASGPAPQRSGNRTSPYVSRASLKADLPIQLAQLHIARSGRHVHTSIRPFDCR